MTEQHTLIIAEAGVNHNGSLELALKLVDEAAASDADIVKFQTFKAENLVTAEASRARYQIQNMGDGDDETQFRMLKRLELSEEDHLKIMERCRQKGIAFLSTPFDLESVDFLHSLGMNIWKIPSGDITNFFLLKKIARMPGRVILSTGMSTIDEVEEAMKVLQDNGKDKNQITLLHCTTQYPTPMSDVNLRAISLLEERFGVVAGYSDHTQGIEVPIAAVALGARVIEKHFTLDRSLPGPDHKASLTPRELKQMVDCIRNIEVALGKKEKMTTASERENKSIARKSLVASRKIKKGERLTVDNVTAKRPGNGISPMKFPLIEGVVAIRDFEVDEIIEI